LPEGLYEIRQPLGDELIGLRQSFLSAGAVRNAYLGYAHQQFEKLKRTTIKMDDHEDPEIKRARRSKNARHLVRLVLQGLALHTEGMIPIRLPSPEWVKETAEEIIRDPRVGSLMLKGAHLTFDEPGVLPEQPDVAAVEEWLHAVRYAFLWVDTSSRVC
jgi:hypothetical protein